MPQVKKVVFVVDRKDLDYQTTKEFNSFSKGSIDGTDNTKALVKQFSDDTKLIVTTIQKLNTAISKSQYLSKMEKLKEERIIFIFDECHRSQFGETHNRIKDFFNNYQMFGFTGTPIFADNAVKNELGKRTTKELFGECLHKYVITDAIKDENVLKFSIEYVGRYKQKDSATAIDIEVEDIDTKELMEAPVRLEKIADYIIAHHNRKTYNKEFTAMFCVSSVDTLIKYYDILQQKKLEGQHNLKVATIFSYTANEDDADANGFIPEELSVVEEPRALYGLNVHTREKLDEFIGHYNTMFETKFSTKDSESFYNYYNDISKKVKERKVDILLVVNMFLTGFDSKPLNTLYVDKNLKYHGLIQAYSRTNRILNEQKSQGNIIVFRNLKKATDEAITLFSNKEAIEEIIMKPYEDYVKKFNDAFIGLLKVVPTVNSVNNLQSEEDELEFIKAFRELMRIKNTMATFADFVWEDLAMNEQLFEDYKSKHLDKPMKKSPLLLKQLWQEDLNFLLTNRIPRITFTHWMGWFSRIRSPWLTRASMVVWNWFTPLDLSDARTTRFNSLHECFTRELKPGARPFDADADVVCSPSDGIVGACGAVQGTSVFQAKRYPYNLVELLGSVPLAQQVADGRYITLRLTAAMYHRFHTRSDVEGAIRFAHKS
jgi:type I restriction enzyme R subunit